MMTSRICLLHDNTRAHNVRALQQLLQSLNWEVLDNPSYSPVIASSNLHLFVHLKKHVAGQKFHEDKEVKNEVIILYAGGGVL